MDTIQQRLFEKSNVRRQYTQADEQQFAQAEQALGENGFDVYGPGANRNAELTDEFFQRNRQLPVTVDNIYRAVSERKSEFVWLSRAEADWYRTAQQNIDLANSLPAFLAAQGQPGYLVKDGDAAFENLVLLFNELHSRRETASSQTIASAEDRIAHRPGKQLHRVAQPRRTEPMSRAAKEFDGVNPFTNTGLTKQRDGSYGKSPADYAREAREYAEKNNPQPTEQEKLSVEEATWKRMAHETLRYGTHASQAQIRKVFDDAQATGYDWRRTYEACNKLVNEFKRRAAVSVR